MNQHNKLRTVEPESILQAIENITTDVVLVRPRDVGSVPDDAPVQDPLGVGYLASFLRQQGHSVLILDAHSLNITNEMLLQYLEYLKPLVVALSLHSFADYKHCVEISRGLKRNTFPSYCVWGGEHATYHAANILQQHPEVDAVALGEGEGTLHELIQQVTEKGIPDTAISGLIYRNVQGRLTDGGFRNSISDLNSIPDPHKDIVETALRMNRPVSLSILSGRGCTHNCSFCTAHSFMRLGGGRVWRRRSPKLVVDELEKLSNRYLNNPLVHPVIQFQDVIFLGTSKDSKKWIEEYVYELECRKIQIPFYCMARADAIVANQEILPRLVAVGLWSVEMGLESGVDRLLQMYNKLNSVDENETAVKLLRKHGVTFDASGYIMFDPYMTLDELRENAIYLSQFGAATWDFFVTRLQLYPGTAVREKMIQDGFFDAANDIGRTAGYKFIDPLVEQVADHAYYYNLSIRSLDLLLRDAKAHIANSVRQGMPTHPLIEKAIELVHQTYCGHLLSLIDCARQGSIVYEAEVLIQAFLDKVKVLTELMEELLDLPKLVRSEK